MGDEEDKPPQCHCQAGRLMIVIGHAHDRAIGAAKSWSLGLKTKHLHKIFFPLAPGTNLPLTLHPHVPDGQGDFQLFTPKKKGREFEELSASFTCCCFFEEALIIAHGHEQGLEEALIKYLPMILDRPTLKLVFWVCQLSEKVYPKNPNNKKTFEQLSYIIRPPERCPCGCVHEDCRAFGAEGNGGLKCPNHSAKTTLLTAGTYEQTVTIGGLPGKQDRPSKLGLDTDPTTTPLTMPPGSTFIQTTVTSSNDPAAPTTSSQAVGPPTIFGKIVPRPDSTLKKSSPAGIDKSNREVPSAGTKPTGYSGDYYQGPKRDAVACPHGDGCLNGGASTGMVK